MGLTDQERVYWEAEAQGWADTTSEADLRSKSVVRVVPEQEGTDNIPQGEGRNDLPPHVCSTCGRPRWECWFYTD